MTTTDGPVRLPLDLDVQAVGWCRTDSQDSHDESGRPGPPVVAATQGGGTGSIVPLGERGCKSDSNDGTGLGGCRRTNRLLGHGCEQLEHRRARQARTERCGVEEAERGVHDGMGGAP